jgi:hypothetical protein
MCLFLRDETKLEVLRHSEKKFDLKEDELTRILGFYATQNVLISATVNDWEGTCDKADKDLMHSFDLRI